jgi:excisionase family DNA binding protein
MTDRSALYVRIPTPLAESLDRLAFEKRMAKQEIVADALRRITVESGDDALTVGHAEVHPAPAPDVLTLSGVAELLQVEKAKAKAMAEQGELPGRRIGGSWRFSREAVLRWLAGG